MNLKGIKKNIASKYLEKHQSNSKNQEENKLDRIKTVGILAEEELFKAYDFTKKLSDDLDIHISDINVMLFQKVKFDHSLDLYEFFSDKSFNMFGKVKDKKLKAFVDKKYDILINYCYQDNVFAHVVALQSKAKMKMSFENEITSFYHLTINIPGNKINTFNDEIIKYLKILNLVV